MNHFADIGFVFQSNSDLGALINSFPENKTKKYPVENGMYLQMSDDSGSELWVQVDASNNFVGVNPYFSGKSKRKVQLVRSLKREGFDGGFIASALPEKDNDAEYPFMFDSPDFLCNKLDMPTQKQIQLIAFAHRCSFFQNEEEFKKSDLGKLATKAFIPSGLFSPNGEKVEPKALGIFSGIVLEFQEKKNMVGKGSFYWALVETLSGQIDIVCEIQESQGKPAIGFLMHGEFWLTGRILE